MSVRGADRASPAPLCWLASVSPFGRGFRVRRQLGEGGLHCGCQLGIAPRQHVGWGQRHLHVGDQLLILVQGAVRVAQPQGRDAVGKTRISLEVWAYTMVPVPGTGSPTMGPTLRVR